MTTKPFTEASPAHVDRTPWLEVTWWTEEPGRPWTRPNAEPVTNSYLTYHHETVDSPGEGRDLRARLIGLGAIDCDLVRREFLNGKWIHVTLIERETYTNDESAEFVTTLRHELRKLANATSINRLPAPRDVKLAPAANDPHARARALTALVEAHRDEFDELVRTDPRDVAA